MTRDESAWLDTAPWGMTPRVAERLRATAIEDPVLGRSIRHGYDVATLPVLG